MGRRWSAGGDQGADGGLAFGPFVNTAEIFTPGATIALGTWLPTTGAMAVDRHRPTVTLLLDGRVLVTGGSKDDPDATFPFVPEALASAEIYDSGIGLFTAVAGGMSDARFGHTATRLTSGKVLVAGGYDNAVCDCWLDSAELFDPITNTFSDVTGLMGVKRLGHTATLMGDGKVLLAGGESATSTNESTAAVYDPGAASGSEFSAVVDTMAFARIAHTSTLLPDGMVLLAGGGTFSLGTPTVDLYEGSPISAPVADAGPDQTVTADIFGLADVTLVGTGVGSDVPLSYEWATSPGGVVLGTGPTLLLTLGPGVYMIDLTVTDDGSLTDTDTVTVSVMLPGAIGPTGSAGSTGATGCDRPAGCAG